MKVLMKPIFLMRSDTDMHGKVFPRKFKFETEEKKLITVVINSFQFIKEERLAGNRMLIYRCQSIIDGIEKVYELKYEVASIRWFLWKM